MVSLSPSSCGEVIRLGIYVDVAFQMATTIQEAGLLLLVHIPSLFSPAWGFLFFVQFS